MLKWLIRWASHRSATPERLAERALHELRVELYEAEQRVLDAKMQADYYRTRILFCEEVLKQGIERVSDVRREDHQMSPHLQAEPRLSVAQSAVHNELVSTTLDAAASRSVFAAKGG
ncbi:hypothetical protein LJR267_009128 [Paraburkholderia hospita]|uniref:hypothetical protein n=1 Tax=Paraburkholderia hospita TaxID=169430 RepID=UPI003ECC2A57